MSQHGGVPYHLKITGYDLFEDHLIDLMQSWVFFGPLLLAGRKNIYIVTFFFSKTTSLI